MVPEALGGAGRRAARIPPHAPNTARKAVGLEAAIVDNDWMFIGALEENDPRRVQARVAGPSALLVAKLHKIAERQSTPRRQDNKDAMDVFRLLVNTPSELLGTGLRQLLNDPTATSVTQAALGYLGTLFEGERASGSHMVAAALEGLTDTRTVLSRCNLLAAEVLEAAGYPSR
jgi:hypothetical protein